MNPNPLSRGSCPNFPSQASIRSPLSAESNWSHSLNLNQMYLNPSCQDLNPRTEDLGPSQDGLNPSRRWGSTVSQIFRPRCFVLPHYQQGDRSQISYRRGSNPNSSSSQLVTTVQVRCLWWATAITSPRRRRWMTALRAARIAAKVSRSPASTRVSGTTTFAPTAGTAALAYTIFIFIISDEYCMLLNVTVRHLVFFRRFYI